MAGTLLLLLLALECPALPTGVGGRPFPSLAPPITLQVDGKLRTLVVCLVLDVAPPDLDSPVWFSTGNGSALDAFTYGPSLATDGTWTSLAQLSLPSEELAAWEPLVCHTRPGPGGQSRSTEPLQLSGGDGAQAPVPFYKPGNQDMVGGKTGSKQRRHEGCPREDYPGEASTARTCVQEPHQGTPSQALRLGALRLLLFKLLLFDVLLTCTRAPRPHPPHLAPVTGGPHSTCSPAC